MRGPQNYWGRDGFCNWRLAWWPPGAGQSEWLGVGGDGDKQDRQEVPPAPLCRTAHSSWALPRRSSARSRGVVDQAGR